MIATVHNLFPGAPPERAQPAPASHPLVAELQQAAAAALDELIRRMFDSADDALFEMGEKSASDDERRRYFDTMRVLRLDRGKVSAAFSEELLGGFAATAAAPNAKFEFDIESLSIQPTEELEEKIALTNMAAKAEGLYKTLIWELERHLDFAARELAVPVSPLALGPGRICDAFGNATAVLNAEFQIKLVIYKLFDRVVISELDSVYGAALAVLQRHGIDPRRRVAQQRRAPPDGSALPPPAASPQAAPGGVPRPAAAAGHAQAPAEAQELLRRHAFDQAGVPRAGSLAGTEIAALLQTLIATSSTPAVQATAQRLSLASQLFDELMAEPLLPDPLRQTIEKLRYPVYKTALSDSGFFASQAHPLRKLLSDMVEQAVSSHASDAALTQLRETMRAAAALQNGPALSMDALNSARPISDSEVEEFLAQMREQGRARREAVLVRVRRQVAQELEVQTLGRQVPDPVMWLLRGGVGPLMAVRLLKSGRGSALYREAKTLMEGVLKSLEFIPPAGPQELQSRKQLLSKIVTALADVGMAGEKIESLLNGLQQVYALLDQMESAAEAAAAEAEQPAASEEQQPDSDIGRQAGKTEREAAGQAGREAATPAAGDTSASLMALLRRVLAPESWFRVYDAEHGQTRWLKLNSFYPEQDAVSFTGFDDSLKLSIRAHRFAEDLASGQSEPINPDDSAKEALEQLRLGKTR